MIGAACANELTSANSIHPAAAPHFVRGRDGGLGVLLLHGLTASPTEMRPLADALAARDSSITISCPLLSGHGTTPEDLRRVGADLWAREVASEVDRLATTCGSISVMGVSMGAVLAAQVALSRMLPLGSESGGKGVPSLRGTPRGLKSAARCESTNAAQQRARIESIGLLAPVFGLKPGLATMLPLLRLVLRYKRKSAASRANHRVKKLFTYDCYPLASLQQLQTLGRGVRKRLADLQIPVLLAGGGCDSYVSAETLRDLQHDLGRERVTFVDCPNSGHILTHEPDADHLFESIYRFLKSHHQS